jgi:hypothetical protein
VVRGLVDPGTCRRARGMMDRILGPPAEHIPTADLRIHPPAPRLNTCSPKLRYTDLE